MSKPDRTCVRCGREFEHPCHLRKHQARKTPCDIVLSVPTELAQTRPSPPNRCSYCSRSFTTATARYRHQREACKAMKLQSIPVAEKQLGPLQMAEKETKSLREELAAKTQELEGLKALRNAGAPHFPQYEEKGRNNVQTNIQNLTVINAPVTTHVLAVGPTTIASAAPVGWPSGWPSPPAPPAPFPSSFTIPLEVLRRALALDAAGAEACRRGDPAAIATLMTEIVRLTHADPTERNMYLNPRRADQVLVYIPERWEVRPLLEAVGLVFDHVAGEITEALAFVGGPLQGLAQAARASFQAQRDEVVRKSRGAMTAHLENMTARARCGDTGDNWLGTLSSQHGGPRRQLGRERKGHLSVNSVVDGLERALGVYDSVGLEGGHLPDMARRALYAYARLLLADCPENLTVASLRDGYACVWTERGWDLQPAAKPAKHQAAKMLQGLKECLSADESPKYLARLAIFITDHLDELAGEEGETQEVIAQYARAAEKVYGAIWVQEQLSAALRKLTPPPAQPRLGNAAARCNIREIDPTDDKLEALLADLNR